MACTGSGKTAAFVFPLIDKLKKHLKIEGPRALVLSPTRELSLQTHKAKKLGPKNILLYARDKDLRVILSLFRARKI